MADKKNKISHSALQNSTSGPYLLNAIQTQSGKIHLIVM